MPFTGCMGKRWGQVDFRPLFVDTKMHVHICTESEDFHRAISARLRVEALRSSPAMPIAEPETALAATVTSRYMSEVIERKIVRPAAF
jgi:hypothetical protein